MNNASGSALDTPTFEPLDLSAYRWKTTLLEALVDSAFLADESGLVLDVNTAAEQLFRCDSAELLGQKIDKIFECEGEGLPQDRESVLPANGASTPGNKSFRALAVLRSEGSVCCDVTVSSLTNPPGDARWLITAQNTSRRDFEQGRILESLKVAAATDLAARIANDFNNQLSAITGNIEATCLQLQNDGIALPEALAGAREASDNAARIVRRLESIARPAPSRCQLVNPSEIVERTLSVLRTELPTKIEMRSALDHDSWLINADAEQMSDTLVNMGINARDAMPAGGVLSISTSQRTLQLVEGGGEQREYVQIDVTDTGCGISKETLPRIFEAFFTTHKTRQGAGLGLASIYSVLSQHKGGVTVESTLGVGTTFHVFLPRESESTAELRPQSKLGQETGSETILIIDDEASVRRTTRRALEYCGYQVLEASDGIEGLKAFNKEMENIGLVILDIVMPEMSGWDVLVKLKAIAEKTPVIVVSGYAGADQTPEHLTTTAEAFLRKPFELAQLTSTVRRLIDHGTGNIELMR